jgi:hypothetical protein
MICVFQSETARTREDRFLRFFPPPGEGEGRVRGIFGFLGLVSEDPPRPGPSPSPGGGMSEKPPAMIPPYIFKFLADLFRHPFAGGGV